MGWVVFKLCLIIVFRLKGEEIVDEGRMLEFVIDKVLKFWGC